MHSANDGPRKRKRRNNRKFLESVRIATDESGIATDVSISASQKLQNSSQRSRPVIDAPETVMAMVISGLMRKRM